jgi:hypothetical protein
MRYAVVNERDALDKRIITGEPVAVEELKAALADNSSLTDEQSLSYAQRLLEEGLATRDADIASFVAELMDTDSKIDQALAALLNENLADQPDAVYAFIRAHLNEKVEKRWTSRLKMAALFSLRVAINDAGSDTIISWLTLIAREPASYDLNDVLHYGILAAQERAHNDPELARQLVVLAAKRDPANLDVLLNDPVFMAALPNNIGRTLRDMDGDPLSTLQNRGPEVFLVAMARAAHARAGIMFTPASITKIWELFISDQPANMLPPHYQAQNIIQQWVHAGHEFLTLEGLETILVLMLTSRRDDLLQTMFSQSEMAQTLLPMLVPALERAQWTINEALDLIGRLLVGDFITPDQAADMYVGMLTGLQWSKESLPLMQQLARLMQQYPALALSPNVLWNLLGAAGEGKDEFIARVAVKRLVSNLESTPDDTQLLDTLKRMANQTQWSEGVRQYITAWWRSYARNQPLNHLNKLDKALEGKRALEHERDIVQTLIALRKMLGQRSLQAFAAEVHAAFSVLEALSESFDPNAKRQMNFDPLTVRDELDTRGDQIPPEERQVLSNNLKELAQLIAEMGDNRTKSNLIRRGDDLDRDLMSGEQTPHSAVDAMKWLAGYWGTSTEKPE